MINFNTSGQIFPKSEKNKLYKAISESSIPTSDFSLDDEKAALIIEHKPSKFVFAILPTTPDNGAEVNIQCLPDVFAPIIIRNARFYKDGITDWDTARDYFAEWVKWLELEYNTPDLWVEAAKTAQLFAPTAEPADNKFTRTELAEVQGQLRQLQQSFAAAALPEAARQKLIELTQTAATKAETLTKKDWQNWIIGGFISAITALALNPTQAGDVLKLVKAAFGGLFLH